MFIEIWEFTPSKGGPAPSTRTVMGMVMADELIVESLLDFIFPMLNQFCGLGSILTVVG